MKVIEIYTDGSSKPNPGPGTGAFVVVDGKKSIYEESFYLDDATNNITELNAVIKALRWAQENYPSHRIYLYTDSQYVQLGMTEHLPQWKKRNWKTSANTPVRNRELWEELDKLFSGLTVNLQWVRGHSDNKWNKHVDELCTAAYKEHEEAVKLETNNGDRDGKSNKDQESLQQDG